MVERLVLGVTGSIAAYKAVDIARLLTKRGVQVQAMLTEGATRFVTSLTFESITGRAVRQSVWGLTGNQERKIEHVEDAYAAQRVLIAPASANFLARYALGMADDALTATLLSTTAPVWIAPAMETNMWRHPATQHNVEVLAARGARILGPARGDLASGRAGEGRMWEPEQIVQAVMSSGVADFEGFTVVITAGPTWEPLDPVRLLTNRSTGSLGIAIADAAAQRGAHVRLILGPTHLAPRNGRVEVDRVETAQQMLSAAQSAVEGAEVFIATAAVSDFRPADARAQKLKRSDPSAQVLRLAENPDILATVGAGLRQMNPRATVVGFAAETDEVIANAKDKLIRKGCDLMIGNEVGPNKGFGAGSTSVLAVRRAGEPVPFGPADKPAVAEFILDQVLELRTQQPN